MRLKIHNSRNREITICETDIAFARRERETDRSAPIVCTTDIHRKIVTAGQEIDVVSVSALERNIPGRSLPGWTSLLELCEISDTANDRLAMTVSHLIM